MATLIKIARTAEEFDHVYWLRHEVYVIEDGKFGGQPLPGERIVDKYDAMPAVKNIIAYDDGEPVGTLRINLDQGIGLPAEVHYDFSRYRAQAGPQARFGSGGMLAVRERWRRRREVIYALFKTAIGLFHSWGVTHLLASVNHETVSIYQRGGFEPIDEPVWIESIGNDIVPLAAEFGPVYQWAFGDLLNAELDRYWLDTFSDHFDRLLLGPGEVLFSEGDAAEHAYIVDNGWVIVSRKDPEGREFALATLSQGALLGELALIDRQPRSATATASTSVELIRLRREDFLAKLSNAPERLWNLLNVFAGRIRKTDDLVMVMAYAPQAGRVQYALEELRQKALPDRKHPEIKVVKIGPAALARSAGVREHEVRHYLELEKSQGYLDYGERMIKFFPKPRPGEPGTS